MSFCDTKVKKVEH